MTVLRLFTVSIICHAEKVKLLIEAIIVTNVKKSISYTEMIENLKRDELLAHLGSWELNCTTDEIYWTDGVYRIFGKDLSSFNPEYMSVLNCVYPGDRNFVEDTVKKSLNEKSVFPYELKYRIIHGITGQIRWVFQKYVIIRDSYGIPLEVKGIIQDVTDNENILNEYSKFFQAVRFANNPILITDGSGRISYINQNFENIYKYDLNNLYGRKALLLSADKSVYLDNGYSEQEYRALMKEISVALNSGTLGNWEGELITRTKEGRIIFTLALIHTLRDMDKNLQSCVVSIIDITRERQQEEHVRIDIYKTIASLAEHRDNETGTHMKRIGEFCYYISKKLKTPKWYSDDIRLFAPLHDIGKVGISDEILKAPRSLTAKEFNTMKTHTSIGYDILKDRTKLEMAAEIAGNHHEKYDGTGYPAGISAESIPLSARICAIADVYDSLRSKRCYKEALSEEETINIITEGSGKHFDPQLVDLLIENRGGFDSIFKNMRD